MMSEIREAGQSARRTSNSSNSNSSTRMLDFAYRIVPLMHDNPILPIFRSLERLLAATGLGAGQSVLEVGCGRIFLFTKDVKGGNNHG